MNWPSGRMPRHVAIIMDGNRRWAKARGLPGLAGHRAGVEALRPIIEASCEWGIKALTIFAFSTENWSRPAAEVAALMGLIEEFFNRQIDELHRQGVRIRVIGERENVPAAQLRVLDRAQRITQDNTTLTLNIAFNYGGRREIVYAARHLAQAVKEGRMPVEDITEQSLYDSLHLPGPDVDVIIRTSGEMRISNFLLYQSAYAELVFPSVYWPDFNKDEYKKALEEYLARDRRFGGA